jgi:ABC-2 type transport system permease protein
MARNIFGTISTTEALISLIIVTIFGIATMNLAIRTFRYGTLEYSKRLSLSTIFGLKNKK